MAPEWYFMLLNNPQEFWNLLRYCLTAPFAKSGMDAAAFADYFQSVLNHPFRLLVIVLFILLLGGSLSVNGAAIAGETSREREERRKRQTAMHENHSDERSAPCSAPSMKCDLNHISGEMIMNQSHKSSATETRANLERIPTLSAEDTSDLPEN